MATRYKPQDDIPDEVIMLHLIQDYRVLYNSIDKLKNYAKSLERENEHLKDEIWKKTRKNTDIYKKLVENRREKKRYRAYARWLKEQLDKLECNVTGLQEYESFEDLSLEES